VAPIGSASQDDRRRRAQRVGGADQRAQVARVLHPVHHEHRSTGRGRHIGDSPDPRRHDGEDPLRRLGTRQLTEGARADILDRDGVTREFDHERLPPGGPG